MQIDDKAWRAILAEFNGLSNRERRIIEAYEAAKSSPTEQPDENAMELYEFSYSKYGEHVVAMRQSPGGAGLQLFDTVKLFATNNTLKEYERVKDEAAAFAKKIVAQFNKQRQPKLESIKPNSEDRRAAVDAIAERLEEARTMGLCSTQSHATYALDAILESFEIRRRG